MIYSDGFTTIGVRQKAEKIIRDIDFDFPSFTIEEFIGRISALKGREIFMVPWDMPATLFGAWMSDGEEPKEYVFYRSNLPLIHQIHIQLHELAHLLLGHPTLKIDRKLIMAVLKGEEALPFSDMVLLRSPKLVELETEAETLASVIQEQVIRHDQLLRLTQDISSDEKLSRFLAALGMS